jgi:hypothetical protein
MGLSVCPATLVAAPVEIVWELVSQVALYDEWWDARTERIVPEGPATPGQMVYAKTPALGREWDVTMKIEMINPEKHQIQLHIALPLGIVNHETITCMPIDAASCRVQFG